MDLITIIGIAFALAMDSFAVSITSGTTVKHLRIDNALKIAAFFGIFQAVMPLFGWLMGLELRDVISGVDHWMAFVILNLIGFKMICESFRTESSQKEVNPLNVYVLLILSVATSIDAFAVGITFAFLKFAIITPIIVIGVVTFLLSLLGIYAGNKIGQIFKNKIKIIGGLLLIGIGTKIIIEHLLCSV